MRPIGLEGVDRKFIQDMRKSGLHLENLELFPAGEAYLLAEFGGETRADSVAHARGCMRRLHRGKNPPVMKLFDDPGGSQRIWRVRESGLGATAHVPGQKENWEGWEDSAVAPEHLGAYLRALGKLYEKYHYVGSFYGHFGQGCVHTRIDFDLKSAAGVRNFRSFIDEATSLICEFGGSFSGEHGDGQSRAEFLEKMFGPELMEAFREFKSIWDPDWKMNPGKLVRPYRVDENLRFGPHYNPPEPKTHFQYGSDARGFSTAMERCVGVGECRKEQAGTMCPSYRVTGEEMHSTRGRARLLFEMLRGEVLHDGWRNQSVKEALDLCLACKGCKGECPVHVDMATYKAEFLAHYFKGRPRPLHAYAFGYIHRWASLASLAPSMANFLSQTPGFSHAMKWVLGLAPKRRIPTFASETFKSWFAAREIKNRNAPRVILWADTFNDYFHPRVARSAVEVLEDAGFRVVVPGRNLCCGRPFYDFGLLKPAKQYLERILYVLAESIEEGLSFVMLEPSCCSVFRDELTNLIPHNQNARRLRDQTFTLAEFLTRKAPGYRAPILGGRAVLHGHCHQKALMKMTADEELLRRMQVTFEHLDSGCCGMAGAFGYVKGEHYRVSVECGERVLLPRARQLSKEELLVTDGFSCQEQIHQQTGRRSLHLAEVSHLALQSGRREPPAEPKEQPNPENRRVPNPSRDGRGGFRWAAPLGAAVLAASAALLVKRNDRWRRE
jgi:Fe-S oxidoreductase